MAHEQTERGEKSGSENKVPFTTRLADVFRAVAGKPTPHNYLGCHLRGWCIDPDGGDTTKQFLELDGVPVIVRTLQAYPGGVLHP